jgi:hypothetical protein
VVVLMIKRFEFFWSQITSEESERAAQLAEYQTGSEELREI